MARQDPELEAAEDMLIEAWQYLMRLPDRERGWLASTSRSCLPDVLRDPVSDYGETMVRPQLTRRQAELVATVFTVPRCLSLAVRPRDRRLMASVLKAKAGRLPGGFRWEDIWQQLPRAEQRKVTTAALRDRYEQGLRDVMVARRRLEMAV
jgi:hypothetical protein